MWNGRSHNRSFRLCSHGDSSPLPLLPGSDGISRRKLDSRSLELWITAQRAMTLGAIAWGLSAHIAGTRFTLLTAALLFCVTAGPLMLLLRIPSVLVSK